MTGADWESAGFGLYLHWPFCQAKCPYCDFNSHVAAEIDESRWKRAFLAEIDRLGHDTPGRTLSTVFFGGGTPSLMSPDLVADILTRIRTTWPMANGPEITLEANPTSVEAGRFRAFCDAGITRLSMGIQALNDPDLKRLGRMHSAAEARAAFEIARTTFDRVSFDLIYARQHQTLDAWRTELTEALTMAADHLSLYQLTIEDGTVFGARHARGLLPGLPEDDLAADMFALTQELTDQAGLPAYEVSNHAQNGAESRHNLIYWRAGDWGGIGPGAHGRLTLDGTRWATETHLAPTAWLEAVERTGHGESVRNAVPRAEQAEEFLMMGLRLREGIDLARYERLTGTSIEVSKIKELVGMDLVETTPTRLAVTPQGRPLLNAILRELMVSPEPTPQPPTAAGTNRPAPQSSYT